VFWLTDVFVIGLVFNLVIQIRMGAGGLVVWPMIAPAGVFVFSLYLIDGYGARTDMLSLDYASLHILATTFAGIATLLMSFVIIPAGFELQSSRIVILLSFALTGALTLAYRRSVYERSTNERNERSIVFLGGDEDFNAFRSECARLGSQLPLLHVDSADNYESFQSVLDDIKASKIPTEAIVIRESRGDLPHEIPLKLVQLFLQGIPTYTLEIFHQVYWKKIPLYRINPIWLFQEGFEIAREPVFERIKRVSDLLLSLFGLIVFSPLVAGAALAIKLDDGGPVFFYQTRIGRHKVPFRLIKLRTMRETEVAGDLYTRIGDARVTRVGKLLRAARFDELPQLWNVLRGQMSLIGPRAEWDKLVSEYEREIPCYHFRHLVKPGITGWAQVNYRYGTGVQDTLRKLEYDLYYIRKFSFMLDAAIVLKTIHVMLLRKGH
jgi:exopolysaccharide biosynthesis polyprenyl glycosylphosphotransferase